MIRSFISISFILFINFNVLASGFEKLTPEEIGQMDPSSFQEGLQNLSFDIFSKLSMEQQHALLQRTEKTKISLSQGSEILEKEKEAIKIKEEADKYYYGTGGVQYNYQHALELYESAANLGNIEAMLRAASMYILGKGTPENAKKAVKWWKKAANLGDIYAMQKLSFLYSQGITVKQNLETSKYWAQKAKEAKKKNMLKEPQ